ncbi:MAG: MBL fold metallo-hydrolase [Patescibacteria group bacterium]
MGDQNKLFWPLIAIFIFIVLFLFLFDKQLPGAEIFIFQVGQGDAILIKSRGGELIVVDGGPDLSVLKKLGLVLSFWQRQIDYLILSHPHDDHLFGLIEIWRRYQVKNVVRSSLFSDTAADQLFSQLSRQRTYIVSHRQIIRLRAGCSLNFLYPLSESDFIISDVNDSSLVFKFECPGVAVLFTGDAGKKVERSLIDSGLDLSAGFFKISHHGSQTASTPEFLKASGATVAIISVGENNKFGHPATSTLLRLAGLKFKVFRTDFDGDLKIYANNGKYVIDKLSFD